MRYDVRVPSALRDTRPRVLALQGSAAVLVLAAVAVYATTDSEALSTTCYLGVLVAASVGAWVGAERAPRDRRLVPRLIAAGVSLTALGDIVWSVLEAVGSDTDVSIADAPWFASYVALCVALWIVLARTRSRSGARDDVDYVVDAVTVVVVSVLVFWSVSIESIVVDESVTPLVRSVWASYPVADAILLALVVRVLMSRNARAAVGLSFGVGVCLWLAADLIYLHGSSGAQVLADAAWMVAPVLAARAAWRVGGTERDVSDLSAPGGSIPQIVLAVAPLLVPAALELVSDLRGQPDQPLLLLIGTVALITLAFVRTARLVCSEQHARRELEVARDAALAASTAKSMFLANVSHEVRTPLTTMLATAELLEDTSLDESQLMLLTKMQRSGDLLRKLVEGILDFSRIEAGQLELISTELDLHDLVANIADAYVPRAAQVGIRFGCDLDPRLPRTVVGDPGRLFQVLTNLLDNALKFTDHGTVDLVVRPATDEAGDSELVELVVRDTGVGIGHADQAAVFESFRQIDGSTTRRHGGSGLGLAICKELVALMGGSITLHSELGVGSTFVVRLPLARPVRAGVTPAALPLSG